MSNFKTRILAGIAAASISAVTVAAFAQVPPPEGQHGRAPSAEQIARFEQMRAKRQAELHDKLKITASQEAAWKLFLDKTQPAPFDPAARPSKEEFAKLTTPERLDKKLEFMRKREAFAEQRIAATKEFYAALSPEQQKTFDTEFAKMERHHFERMQHERKGSLHRGDHGGKPAPDATAPAAK
ncbi:MULTISPECIES: Spy/CpxP family protein refolding chaperone [unclassified Herbaspirillum]|uniref:Spy/CpxP family protein refolding chaperone n=1 Tax=unclassified Herbaspirillum TaxID=2624150 RepID=UPI0011533A74|nr:MULTISPECIES: Spy/CpxP family protein refolding chaperone [unclassified Herbaspirillum]MBB5391087.1 Spy/CpxP family protein refolding chaperone [Herbaspirillum sp. SJZ102]TQK13222.1 LTXXQ motif family protein [Herbaspirillum sp. SJZ130]TQK15226.1 LTXXQ motif family protein [Herbaspirillum sp. SJZ106]TWC67576.1 LTXXQ motif family protein [Herbaspirillum sp. SJZ099]